jgi:hypothetical protein
VNSSPDCSIRTPHAAAAATRRSRARAASLAEGRPGVGPSAAVAPHQLPRPRRRVAHEGVPLNIIQSQLEHQPRVTAIYLQGIDDAEIIATVHGRSAPMIPASTGLRI